MNIRLLRVREVAAMTGFTENTVRSWRRDGKGPAAAKVGGTIVYRESDVLAWIDAQLTTEAKPA